MSEKSSQTASASKTMFGGNWLNAANFLTALRVLLVPPVILILIYRPSFPYNVPYNTIAGLIFLVAAFTDKLDGYYARKNDLVTKLGQFLDPLADKLLMLPVMILLWQQGLMPFWVLLIVLVREVVISVVRVVGVKRHLSFPATWTGKVKMFSQIVAASVLIFFPGNHGDLVVLLIVYFMAAITAISGIDYLFRARKEIFSHLNEEIQAP